MKKFLLDLIYPPACGFCGEINKNGLCANCKQMLKSHEIATINKVFNKKFDYIINMLKYDKIIRDRIIKYKFNEEAYLYKTFSEIILKNKKICSFLLNYDIIISVPMYGRKKLMRGYNQTELITKEIAQNLGIVAKCDSLVKIKNTQVQSLLNRNDRYENVKNAFIMNENICNKKVILFDDIYTTGNTVNECSRILKKSGVKEVVVLTLAKD